MKPKLAGIGELLWDLLPSGRQMGGAPANFAYHAGALGAESHVISRVGLDDLGRELLQGLERIGLSTESIEIDPAAPTGTVTVEVGPGGEPGFTIHENVAWDRLSGEAPGRRAVAAADAVCFGTLAQRLEPSRSTIRALVRATPGAALRILDVNLRQQYYSRSVIEESLALSNVLKVNDAELPRLAEMFNLGGSARDQIIRISERHNLRLVACTRGANGSLLYAQGHWSDHPGVPTTVVDTIGAGDSFTAAMALGLLAGWELEQINQRANEVASFVASCAGGTPVLPERLREPFRSVTLG
jgi:fructokinase